MDTNMNMPSPQMALRISGTKQRQAGFAPLVAIGVLPGGEGSNMDRTIPVDEKPAYVIKHAPDYILYQAIDRKVKSFDADASGVLSIALTIPRAYQLAGGKSPYTLLTEIYNKFVTEYMSRLNDGRDSFLNRDVHAEEFVAILNRYPLEARSTVYVPMNPAGETKSLCLPQEKMADFFRDSQYAEFAGFKDLVIGLQVAAPTFDASKLEIPRPVRYQIYENGRSTMAYLSNSSDFYRTNVAAGRYEIYDNFDFTLQELLAANGSLNKNGGTVVLDVVHGRINCTVRKRDIMYSCYVQALTSTRIEEETISDLIAVKRRIHIMIGSRDLVADFTCANDSWQIPGELAAQAEITIQPTKMGNYNLSVKSSQDPERKALYIDVLAHESRVAGIAEPVGTPAGSRPPKSRPDYGKQNRAPRVYEDEVDQSRPAYPREEEKKSRPWMFLLIGVLIGLLVGGVVVYLLEEAKYVNEQKALEQKQQEVVAAQAEAQRQQDAAIALAVQQQAQEEAEAAARAEAERQAAEEHAKAEQARKAEEAKKAQDDAKRQAALDRETARTQILALVNAKELQACRNHAGWKKYLSNEERLAVEAVLFTNKYTLGKYKDSFKKPAILKNAVEDYVKSLGTFDSYEKLLGAGEEIKKMEDDAKKK